MEWSKLKNIILLLLVSVNAFLLILVGVQESRAARYEEDTRQAAVRVLEQSGITFGPERVPQEAGLSPLTVTRDRESEAIVAQTLLGDVSREGENDVRHRYSSVQGTAEFSMNGTFSVRFNLAPGSRNMSAPTRMPPSHAWSESISRALSSPPSPVSARGKRY